MKTPMLKRRLNPFLLATTILVLSILAALSVLWQGNLSDLQTEKNNLSQTLEEKNQRIQTLQMENSNLTQRIDNLENDVQTYTGENELLRSQIDSLNSTVENLQNYNSRLQEENEELSGLNDTLGDICSDSSNNITSGDYFCDQYGHSYEGN